MPLLYLTHAGLRMNIGLNIVVDFQRPLEKFLFCLRFCIFFSPYRQFAQSQLKCWGRYSTEQAVLALSKRLYNYTSGQRTRAPARTA
jgi:hypothetical protein